MTAPAGWTSGQIESRSAISQKVKPGSYSADERTVEAIFATGYRVRRWFGWEELAIRDDAINLARIGLGKVRLLDHHNQFERNAVLGVVTDARVERGVLIGTIRFADSDAGREAELQVSSGDLTGISVGYRINKLVLAESGEDDDVYRAEAWELLEVSLVSVPADPHAGVRSINTNSKDSNLAIETETVVASERQRAADIAIVGRRAGMTDDDIQAAIRGNTPIAEFRERAFEKLAGEADQVRISSVQSGGWETGSSNVEQAIQGALIARMTGGTAEGNAREFMEKSLLDMGRCLLEARGERVSRVSRDQLVERIMVRGMHTTSDFPTLLTNASNRVLHDSYTAAATPLKLLARIRERTDFRPVTGVALSEAPQLLRINESGEIKSGTRAEESRPRYSLNTFGRIFSLTRAALINDDLNAFTDALTAFGQAAAQVEADELAALFAANNGAGVALWDNKALFHASHKNLATAAPLSVEGIGATRTLMREQVGLDGKTFINIAPKHIVVPPALETKAEQVLSARVVAAEAANAVPNAIRDLQLHVEPRLSEISNTAYYLVCHPASMPVIEISYLAGSPGPQIIAREGFETLGLSLRATLDFGCGIIEWRGAARNPG